MKKKAGNMVLYSIWKVAISLKERRLKVSPFYNGKIRPHMFWHVSRGANIIVRRLNPMG